MFERFGEIWEAMSAMNWALMWSTLTEIFADAWNQVDPFTFFFGGLIIGGFLLVGFVVYPLLHVFGILG
jgi:hypothetical protein